MSALSAASQTDAEQFEPFRFQNLDGSHRLLDGYMLRYRVYCEERRLISVDECLAGLETDEFDYFADHFGAFDHHNILAGTLRLIKPDVPMFPLLRHSGIDLQTTLFGRIEKQNIAEISRLAISRKYRRRGEDDTWGHFAPTSPSTGPATFQADDHRRSRYPELVLGLYRSLYQASVAAGLTHWLAAMEPPLHRLLRRFHINFQQIGPTFDYFGPVTPYCASIRDVEHSFFTANPSLQQVFSGP